jgi:hypothetical protein
MTVLKYTYVWERHAIPPVLTAHKRENKEYTGAPDTSKYKTFT